MTDVRIRSYHTPKRTSVTAPSQTLFLTGSAQN